MRHCEECRFLGTSGYEYPESYCTVGVSEDDPKFDEDKDGCAEVCERFICPDCPEWNKEYDECENDESFCIDRMDEFFKTHELYKAGRRNYYVIWKCRKKGEGEQE